MIDINGIKIKEGDIVHCWDGDINQKNTTQSLYGVVTIKKTEGGDGRLCVGDNELALGCADYVEIIKRFS